LHFSRQKEGVVGVDVVDEEASRKNFLVAEEQNEWFKSEFVELKKGDALNLPIEDESIDIAAQNCLYFKKNRRFETAGNVSCFKTTWPFSNE
jgi:hypothetical protein